LALLGGPRLLFLNHARCVKTYAGLPKTHAAFELSAAEQAWLRLLEVLKQRLGLQPWFKIEPLPNFLPNLGERIGPRPLEESDNRAC
jgi:hypothetical protein